MRNAEDRFFCHSLYRFFVFIVRLFCFFYVELIIQANHTGDALRRSGDRLLFLFAGNRSTESDLPIDRNDLNVLRSGRKLIFPSPLFMVTVLDSVLSIFSCCFVRSPQVIDTPESCGACSGYRSLR